MIQEMDLMEIFYWFHRHPELSYEEYDTTAQIKTVSYTHLTLPTSDLV